MNFESRESKQERKDTRSTINIHEKQPRCLLRNLSLFLDEVRMGWWNKKWPQEQNNCFLRNRSPKIILENFSMIRGNCYTLMPGYVPCQILHYEKCLKDITATPSSTTVALKSISFNDSNFSSSSTPRRSHPPTS